MSELVIPKDWIKKDFLQITNSFNGLRVPLNKLERSKIQGDFPYYGATGQVDSINDYKFDGKFLLITEDASLSNPINRKKPIAFIVQGKFWVNNHAHVVQTNEELDLDFLCYYINSIQIMDYAQKQGTRAKLNKTSLEKIPVVFPTMKTQKQIVTKLDHILGELEVKKKEILSLIEQNKQRIDFFEKNWMSYVIDREIEKQSQKNKWDLIQLEQISKIIDSLHETPQYSKEGIPMVRSTEIKAGNLNLQTALLVSKEIYEKFTARYKPKRNDIVMSRVGTYFVTSFVNTDDAFCMGQNTLIIHPLINPEFLYFYLNSKSVEKQIQEKLVGSSGQKTLSLKHIRSLLLVSPSLLIQKQIVQNIKSAEEKFQIQKKQFENIKNNYESKIKYINHIQSSVLDSAFSGKLVQ
jgi:type I restriction enzyme, S subunit